MELSIVSTLFRSAEFLPEFYRRITEAAERAEKQYELIFVNDGSPDNSLDIASALLAEDNRIRIVDLSRNFGHHTAAVAGLEYATGDSIFIIDCDLEEDPDWLDLFTREAERTKADVVYGVATGGEKRGVIRHGLSVLFYRLFNLLSEIPIPEHTCTARLMTRRYVDALLSLQDKSLFLAGSYAWTGFSQKGVSVEKDRRKSKSNYSALRMFDLFVNAITSFSPHPLYLIFVIGVGISTIASLLGMVMIVAKLLSPSSILSGWASIMVSIWFLGGLIIAILGVLGIYISKIFTETKNRPRYVVKEIYTTEE